MKSNTKKLTTIAMLTAISFAVVAIVRIPMFMFLEYEPKDVIITIGGFMLGPVASFVISLVVSLVEMVTISATGPIGALMNLLSTCGFACTASVIYKKNHTLKGAIMGLVAATLFMTAIMLLWNYLVTPMYMGIPRAEVVKMLPTIFLPFNVFKGAVNAGIILLIYKPVVGALRKARLVETSASSSQKIGRLNMGAVLIAVAMVATGVLLALVAGGII